MGGKLVFATIQSPPPLEFWTPTKGEAFTRWLPDDEFEDWARKYGKSPDAGALSAWPQYWWQRPLIFLRAKQLDLFGHEVQHIERRLNFHKKSGEVT